MKEHPISTIKSLLRMSDSQLQNLVQELSPEINGRRNANKILYWSPIVLAICQKGFGGALRLAGNYEVAEVVDNDNAFGHYIFGLMPIVTAFACYDLTGKRRDNDYKNHIAKQILERIMPKQEIDVLEPALA